MKAGAKLTYDASKQDDIIGAIFRVRGSLGQVADLNDIPRNTFYGWIRQGDEDNDNGLSTELGQLSCKIRHAQAEVVCELVNRGLNDDKAARFVMWWLGKICREDFGDEGIEIRELRDIFKVLLPLMNKGIDHGESSPKKDEV